MTLFLLFMFFIAIGLTAYYLFRPRVIRILIDPNDKQVFHAIVAAVKSKNWLIFDADYIDCYADMTIIDLTIPSVFFNKIYEPLSKINTIDILEAK